MNFYNREKAVDYAKKWAKSRNPAYYNFDKSGG
ncbi:MAG: amidase domain-containing protein, partial [Oscillospiraceae bacterium]